jgi:hypothetical protein
VRPARTVGTLAGEEGAAGIGLALLVCVMASIQAANPRAAGVIKVDGRQPFTSTASVWEGGANAARSSAGVEVCIVVLASGMDDNSYGRGNNYRIVLVLFRLLCHTLPGLGALAVETASLGHATWTRLRRSHRAQRRF